MAKPQEVKEFIERRFAASKNHWMTDNCYYFALILSERFGGKIYYAPVEGHFVCFIPEDEITTMNKNFLVGHYYDAMGELEFAPAAVYDWQQLPYIDSLLYCRLKNDCIK